MNLQKIKSANGKHEYVAFVLEDYVDNPVALARMKAHLAQKQLAERMGVTQAYISKVERQDKVTPMFLERAIKAIRRKQPNDFKPMPSIGKGVEEIRVWDQPSAEYMSCR